MLFQILAISIDAFEKFNCYCLNVRACVHLNSDKEIILVVEVLKQFKTLSFSLTLHNSTLGFILHTNTNSTRVYQIIDKKIIRKIRQIRRLRMVVF